MLIKHYFMLLQEVTLREGEIVTINSYDVKLPFQSGDLQISRESSIYINVRHAFTGIDVLWDGYSNIYVTVPTHYAGKLCGLAGNYNGNAGDDFTAKNGMLQSTAVAFSNSWRLQSCDFVTTEIPDPCMENNYKKPQAQAACAQIYGEKFFPCHDEIEPEHYYENCLYEYCECTREINDECMCDSLAVYVRKCATKGIDLDWRSPDFCHLSCRGGQVYKRCGSGCDKSCRSLSTPESCNDRCVEGCNCPDNYYLSPAGTCVRPEECPCYHVNTWYRPGQTIPAPGILCQCIRGRLECEGEGTLPSICPAGEIFYNCSQVAMTGQLRGAECSKTCFNKDLPCPLTLCVSGCGCPHGYVRHEEKCILPHNCPCFHNNKGYENGSLIEVDCNQCTCLDGQWSCTRKICGGECSVTGESHIKTFDHKWFDFRGGCEYILATDECRSVNGSFKVVYKTNPCETMGHVCWRTVKLTLGRNQIVLEKDRVPQETSLEDSNGLDIPYKISSHGFFTFIKTGIGLTVLWDGATRIYLQLASFYHDKICGLCGNFDGLENNDFLLRSQDIVTSSSVFGHNWRTKDYCPMSTVPKCLDMCAQYPQRKAWAIEQCRVIESDLFKECREEIDHQKYLDHCLYDTCSCGSGGDCECFCTAVATYAHACAQIGIYVEWRTPTLCPTMCELYNKNDSCEWHFEACGTSCPETCCDHKNQVNCNSPCVEGCFPRCQHGHVFSEEQQTCIPLEECEVCPPTTTVVPGTPSVTVITTKTPVPNTTATTITTPLTAPVCSQFCLDNSNVKRKVQLNPG
ncbi:von Willebrand factor-like [Clavelina lepadiformis]|uniref:von Willebrand factor-like n=1 Tax=Clavelina lepadiformis TaxID=159417 RepID=UPI004042F028